MHLFFNNLTFSIVILISSYSSTHVCAHPVDQEKSRPLQTFFKNVFNGWKISNTTSTPSYTMTTEIPTSLLSDDKVPHFVDYSTYILDTLKSNNSAIKFSNLNSKSAFPKNSNFSVISFIFPHGGHINSENKLFDFVRLPWSPRPTTSDISKFPPFMEFLIQRIQQYFSIYKYEDTSQPQFSYDIVNPDVSSADEAISITTIQNNFMETSTEIFDDINTTTTVDSPIDFATESNEI
ncbi:unnamed protein product [Diamesa serratosioi]